MKSLGTFEMVLGCILVYFRYLSFKKMKRKEIDTTLTNRNCSLVVGSHITIILCFSSPIFL